MIFQIVLVILIYVIDLVNAFELNISE